jgi:hypothetical protein
MPKSKALSVDEAEAEFCAQLEAMRSNVDKALGYLTVEMTSNEVAAGSKKLYSAATSAGFHWNTQQSAYMDATVIALRRCMTNGSYNLDRMVTAASDSRIYSPERRKVRGHANTDGYQPTPVDLVRLKAYVEILKKRERSLFRNYVDKGVAHSVVPPGSTGRLLPKGASYRRLHGLLSALELLNNKLYNLYFNGHGPAPYYRAKSFWFHFDAPERSGSSSTSSRLIKSTKEFYASLGCINDRVEED